MKVGTIDIDDYGNKYQIDDQSGKMWYWSEHDNCWIDERYICKQCLEQGKVIEADERYSMGIYAGKWCDEHWKTSGYRDVGPEEFDPDYCGESYDPI